MNVVYKIINTKTERAYIGSTSHFSQRQEQHLKELKCGTHVNKLLQADYNLYGRSNFVFEFLHTIYTANDTTMRGLEEQEIERHSKYPPGIYNSVKTCRTFYPNIVKYTTEDEILKLFRFSGRKNFRDSANYNTIMMAVDKLIFLVSEKDKRTKRPIVIENIKSKI